MFLMVMDMADSPKDQRKIVKLYEKYNRLMYVIAYNIVQYHEDAEDVVLAAWERIIKNLDKISKVFSSGYLVILIISSSKLLGCFWLFSFAYWISLFSPGCKTLFAAKSISK